MYYYHIAIAHYGWQGLALLFLLLLLFAIQIYYYTFRFRRLGKYLNKSRKPRLKELPAVSLIIPMFTEDYDFIDDTLPLILAQEAVNFEIVIVYVGDDNDFFDDILRLKNYCPNLIFSKIQRNERFPISIKTALNVGIKAANNNHMIFSTTDARPASDRWLSLMARGFQRGEVVLGYCGMERDDERFDSYFIRINRFMDSTTWLSKAIAGDPYRAFRSNMGFTKELYFGVNGFNRLNMNIGEDDLFLQSIMTSDNTSVILSPRATVYQRCWGRLRGWVDTSRYYGSSEKFYPISARNYVAWELTSRVLFFLLSLLGILFLPLELKVIVALVAIIRLIFVLNSVSRVSQRVGEERILTRYPLYDLLSPLFALYMRIVMIKRDKRVWR